MTSWTTRNFFLARPPHHLCRSLTKVHMLRALSPQELRDQLCGEEALDWPLEHLQEAVVPGAGYTRNSQVPVFCAECYARLRCYDGTGNESPSQMNDLAGVDTDCYIRLKTMRRCCSQSARA